MKNKEFNIDSVRLRMLMNDKVYQKRREQERDKLIDEYFKWLAHYKRNKIGG
jgi:hypothetical protein